MTETLNALIAKWQERLVRRRGVLPTVAPDIAAYHHGGSEMLDSCIDDLESALAGIAPRENYESRSPDGDGPSIAAHTSRASIVPTGAGSNPAGSHHPPSALAAPPEPQEMETLQDVRQLVSNVQGKAAGLLMLTPEGLKSQAMQIEHELEAIYQALRALAAPPEGADGRGD